MRVTAQADSVPAALAAATPSSPLTGIPTCVSFGLVDSGWDKQLGLGYFRSDWRGTNWNNTMTPGPPTKLAQPLWIAFKGGNGQANHNDVDAGSFLFEMAGKGSCAGRTPPSPNYSPTR